MFDFSYRVRIIAEYVLFVYVQFNNTGISHTDEVDTKDIAPFVQVYFPILVSSPFHVLLFLLLFFSLLVQWNKIFSSLSCLFTHNCRKPLRVLSLQEVQLIQNGAPLEHLWGTQSHLT